MQTLETKHESRIGQIAETVKLSVRKRTTRWLTHDEGARFQRCEMASAQALRELEQLKSGAMYRTGISR